MKVGVIGAGTMGLTLAHRLGRAGHEVTVLESAPQVGGLATWHDFGDFVWDKYYHVILKADDHLLALIDELGIADKLKWRATKTGFLWNGRHLSMSSNWEFLTFPALSLTQKVRLAAGILYVQRVRDADALERTTAVEWMTRIFGRSVYQAIWEPLLESKFGVLKDSVPATIMWATIRRYYSTRSKGGGTESMGFLSGGGIKPFFDALQGSVDAQGGRIVCGSAVHSITTMDGGSVLVETDLDNYEFDRVISTVSTGLLRKLALSSADVLCGDSAPPKFLGVIRVALVLKRPLSEFYVTNLIQEGFPFTGIIEVSALTGTEELGGRSLVMLPRYDVAESDWFSKSDEEIVSAFVDALRPTWPDIDENLVRAAVARESLVQALWIDAPPVSGPIPRTDDALIWNINAELTGRDTLNNNATVSAANRAADEFLEAISDSARVGSPVRETVRVRD